MAARSTNVKRLPLWHWIIAVIVASVVVVSFATWAADTWETIQQKIVGTTLEKQKVEKQMVDVQKQLFDLQHQDQVVINKHLTDNIHEIETSYSSAVSVYEDLLKLKDQASHTQTFPKLDESFASILTLLSKRNYASASAQLTVLQRQIDDEQKKLTDSFVIPANVPSNNVPPGSGYSRQTVNADIGTYLVDIIAADMGSTRVLVSTASDGTCNRDCPVKSLAEYVSQNGAFAGVNGSYFCPADYPSCADKKNSFDTLLMNKNKVYFNSDNNKYSTVPAVIFLNGSMRFVGQSLEWGRDTSVDGVIANQPLLLSGGNIMFGGNSDPKQGSKGSRSFVGSKGSTAYIGVVHNVTVAEMAHVLKALGLDGALNLDSGGSTALWSGGYKAGPGRGIPNAILFVRK